MSPRIKALLSALAVALWFGFGSPLLVQDLRSRRAAERVEPGVQALAHAIASARPSLLPTGEAAARAAEALSEAALDLEVERGWTLRAAVVLNPSQRLDPGSPPARPRARHQPWMDPELPALYQALGERHGWVSRPVPDLPPFDPWPGVEPRRRAEALRLLAPELSDVQAQIVCALVLDAMDAAGRRAEAEERLRATLDPAVVQLAARSPGGAQSVSDALAALRYRAR